MNRRRRFAAKRKRTARKVLNDLMSTAHFNSDEREGCRRMYAADPVTTMNRLVCYLSVYTQKGPDLR